MKTSPAIGLVAIIAMLATSCSTTVTQQDLVTKIVARRATVEVLRAKPEYRPAFVASVATLDILLSDETADRAAFTVALQSLKIRELKGVEGVLIISDILDILDAALGDKPWFGEGLPRLKSFVLAVNEGMAEGLALSVVPEVIAAPALVRPGKPEAFKTKPTTFLDPHTPDFTPLPLHPISLPPSGANILTVAREVTLPVLVSSDFTLELRP